MRSRWRGEFIGGSCINFRGCNRRSSGSCWDSAAGPGRWLSRGTVRGAEAALATRAFAAAGFNVAATYTFAAPRSGTIAYANSITTPVFRIEYGDDLVPHLPPMVV